jgi:hypothetical protein
MWPKDVNARKQLTASPEPCLNLDWRNFGLARQLEFKVNAG